MLSTTAKCRFGPDRLARLAQLERWHFWFVGRRALLDRLLCRCLDGEDQLVLDLGCGTGSMLEVIFDKGHRAVGLDLRPEGLRAAREALPRALLLQAEASNLPLGENVCDGVMLLDVMEHVDDLALLRQVRFVLRPGGWAIITVPALPWLWSFRDEAAGHLRRYRRRQLATAITTAGLALQEVRYYQCLLLPVVALTRLFGRNGPGLRDKEECPPAALNGVLAWINKLEVRLGRIIGWPAGSSLVAICRKQ